MINSRRVLGIVMSIPLLGFFSVAVFSQERASDLEWKAGGDLRLRHESSSSGGGEVARHRERIRFRVGVEKPLAEHLHFTLRLRTGDPSDARSPYVDLGNGFDSLDLGLDRLFIRWSPSGTARVSVG